MSDGNTTPSGDDYPYDWDAHFALGRDLDALDRIDLMVSRKQMDPDVLQNFVLNGPYDRDTPVGDVQKIDGRILAAYVPVRLRRLTDIVYQQINLTQIRAEFVARSTEDMLYAFPEEKYHPGLFSLSETAEGQLADLGARLQALTGIIASNAPGGLGEAMIDAHRNSISALRSVFRDTAGYDDPVPVAERLPALKSVYQRLSVLSLRQAAVEKTMAEECLAVASTDMVLREIFHAQSNLSGAPFKSLAATSLLAAMIDLDYAASLRHGIYMMDQTARPSFPTGSFLA